MTPGERMRTLLQEQGITIVSILTALQMTLGVLIEALLGAPSVSTTTSESTTTSDNKGGARDEQRQEVRARLQRFQDEQKAINDQTRILKGRYSNHIYQIRESITKFLDKETVTLGERIRTLLNPKQAGLFRI